MHFHGFIDLTKVENLDFHDRFQDLRTYYPIGTSVIDYFFDFTECQKLYFL